MPNYTSPSAACRPAQQDVDLWTLSFDELYAIACDFNDPRRSDANELLNEWQADYCSRRTPAGGAA